MMYTYTKHKLYDIAKENYQALIRFCNILDQEGYWEQPNEVLKMTIYECLDWYVEAVLINLSVNYNTADIEQRRFICTLLRFNPFNISEENEIPKKVCDEASKAVKAPPVLLQLCGLRDNEKSSGLTGLFFDALLNILLAQAYLSSIVSNLIIKYITMLYKHIDVFLYSVVENIKIIDEKYIFYKISNANLEKCTNDINAAGEDFNAYKSKVIGISDKKRGSISRTRKRDFIDKQDTIDKQDYANNQYTVDNIDFADKEEEIKFRQYIKNKLSKSMSTKNMTETGVAYEEVDNFKQYIGNYEEFEDSLEHNEMFYKEIDELDSCIDTVNDNEKESDIEKTIDEIKIETAYIAGDIDNAGDKFEKNTLSNSLIGMPPEAARGVKNESEAINEAIHKTKLDELLIELNKLIGLTDVKKEISSLINLIKVKKMREKHNLPVMDMSYHMVFTGNPGTGKTTVARLVSKLYNEIGLLSTGSLVETDRAGLVAGFVGQTAIKVTEVVEKAIGGVLFIDEAYSLSNSIGANDFGGEAIDTLVKLMEDNRDNLVIIAAGYTKEMESFLKSNIGLVSRFNKYIEFPDYTVDELIQILNSMSLKSGFTIDEDALGTIRDYLLSRNDEEMYAFGNARGIRNMFEKMVMNHANRIVECIEPTIIQLTLIQKEDVYQWEEEGRDLKIC